MKISHPACVRDEHSTGKDSAVYDGLNSPLQNLGKILQGADPSAAPETKR